MQLLSKNVVDGFRLDSFNQAPATALLSSRKKLFGAAAATAQSEDELQFYEGVVWVKLMMAQSIVLGILGKNDFSHVDYCFWKSGLCDHQNPF